MEQFLVTNVIDGDTFEVSKWKWNGNEGTRIRPAGYNAPEMNTSAGIAAKNKLEMLILGKYVVLGNAYKIDRGRLVCEVYYGGRHLSDYFTEYKT